MIRVLLVDDSPLIVQILEAMLEDVADIQVVGSANNGQEALRMATRLKPDVITMDIRMPKMDGLEATRQIMNISPTRIVVLSSAVYATDYNIAFNAIEAGALTVIEKPRGMGLHDFESVRQQLVTTIRSMASVPVVRRFDPNNIMEGVGPMTAMLHAYYSRPIQVIALASSTGGPPVLMQIFSRLPADFSIPVVVVQHILPPFVQGMADWLSTRTPMPVVVAEHGARLAPGKIWISPGDMHLTVAPLGLLHLDQSEPIKSQRPSATRLFESVSRAFGSNCVGIILTGMGDDGVDGLTVMSKAGGHVIAQDEFSSVVFSMPKSAIDRGLVDEVLNPEEIVTRLLKLDRHMKSLHPKKSL